MIKIIFAGTPEFAAISLEALIHDKRFEIVAVLTQPDRPAGRGQKLQASPVKTLALQHQLLVLQPETLKTTEIQETLKSFQADVMIVAAYGLLLPEAVLSIPKHGCINIHGSLLPRWRGAAPVQRAIETGDQETGVTIMQMEKGLDTGGMFYKKTCPITTEDTSASLMQKIAYLGAEALIESLPKIISGELNAEKQNEAEANYAKKLEKAESILNWQEIAEVLERRIRAFSPWPGCAFEQNGQMIKVGKAHVVKNISHALPGEVLSCGADGLVIACGKDALCITQVQIPGGKMQPVAQLIISPKFISLFE
ncbi:MAG: fmt [Gammaproteobacteria bacterium]|jgi:methionyl-tRNA formyltransferase|nr:fmt [Gammaproteobacteria bacterium]